MTNETTASQPKVTNIGEDAHFLELLRRCEIEGSQRRGLNFQSIIGYIHQFFDAPAAQAYAEVVRNNVPGSPHNVCRTTEHNLRKRIAELEAQASATIQAAPEDLLNALCAMVLENDAGGVTLATSGEARKVIEKYTAAIQEPVMVAEPVGKQAQFDRDIKLAEAVRRTIATHCRDKLGVDAARTVNMVELAPIVDRAAPMVADPAGVAAGMPPQWVSEVTGPLVDDLSYGQGYRAGWNDCRAKFIAYRATVKAVPSEALDEPPEREALIACLGDDAATLSHINPDDEMAQTMREAAAMLEADGVPSAALAAIHGLIAVAGAAYHLMDNTEESGPVGASVFKHQEDDNAYLNEALDQLDALPDDQPGYVMGPCAKAEWALRQILAAPLADKTGGGE